MDQWSKTTSPQKRDSDSLQHGATSFLLWFQACQIRLLDLVSEIQTPEREDGIDSDISPVQVSTSVDDRSGQLDETQATKHKPNKKETTIELGSQLYSEIPEWLQEFMRKFGG